MSRIVLVGGGSSSGKSYITEAVIKNVGNENVTRMTMDDYYKDQSDMKLEDRYKVNYDHPKAFDFLLMRKQIQDLKDDKPIEKPIYDFVTLTRTNRTETIYPNKVIIIEGIMALVDKDIRKLGDIKVFISASAERRFLRRLIRDKKERGRNFENIVKQYFASVQPMYDEIVEPSSMYADLIVNNDGVENLSVAVLTSLIKEEIELAKTKKEPTAMKEEFDEDSLSAVFLK